MKTEPWMLVALALSSAGAVELEPISSAEKCARCHRAIHEAWRSSAHAGAMESPLFQDALEMVEADLGATAKKVCIGCHSPLSSTLGDRELKLKVTWEGVTCDYCHSMQSVSMDGANPRAVLNFSLVKTGPLKDAVSGVHESAYSAVHTSSDVCAPCHEYRNVVGFPVLTTYSEWKQSRWGKENMACQECHMGRVEGDIVDPRVKRTAGAKVNLHAMAGGHSLDQLNKAVRARLTTTRGGGSLQVSVELANTGAGHYVPTGSPMRKLTLDVAVSAHNGKSYSGNRSYLRSVAGADGKEIGQEHLAFFKAAKALTDTRLAPEEVRRESFSFPVPDGVSAQVKATLSYHYSPLARIESQQSLVFRSISRFVK